MRLARRRRKARGAPATFSAARGARRTSCASSSDVSHSMLLTSRMPPAQSGERGGGGGGGRALARSRPGRRRAHGPRIRGCASRHAARAHARAARRAPRHAPMAWPTVTEPSVFSPYLVLTCGADWRRRRWRAGGRAGSRRRRQRAPRPDTLDTPPSAAPAWTGSATPPSRAAESGREETRTAGGRRRGAAGASLGTREVHTMEHKTLLTKASGSRDTASRGKRVVCARTLARKP